MDKLETIELDGHIWEVGFFKENDCGFEAYGFRQDGIYIRATSKYEAEIITKAFRTLTKAEGKA